MNDFKIYQKYKESEIHYKVLYGLINKKLILEDKTILKFILSYPDNNIWDDNKYHDFDDGHRMYYKKIPLSVKEWAKIKNYSDCTKALDDFDDAIEEFKSDKKWQEYKNEVNVYFLKQADEIIKNL